MKKLVLIILIILAGSVMLCRNPFWGPVDTVTGGRIDATIETAKATGIVINTGTDTLYLATEDGIEVFDISDLTSPRSILVSNINNAKKVGIYNFSSNPYLLVSGYGFVRSFDISTPNNLSPHGNAPGGNLDKRRFHIYNETTYYVATASGIDYYYESAGLFFNSTYGAGIYNANGVFGFLYGADVHLCIAAQNGFAVYNTMTMLPTSFINIGECIDVIKIGTLTYVITTEKLVILEIANPNSINEKGEVKIGDSRDFIIDGDYAYIATKHGTKIVDISNTSKPVIESIIQTGNSHDLFLLGNYLYVATDDGLKIVKMNL